MAAPLAALVSTAAELWATEVVAPLPPPPRTLVGLPPPFPPLPLVTVELEKGADEAVAMALLAVSVVTAEVTTTPLPSSILLLAAPVAPAAAELCTETNPGPASTADWASA